MAESRSRFRSFQGLDKLIEKELTASKGLDDFARSARLAAEAVRSVMSAASAPARALTSSAAQAAQAAPSLPSPAAPAGLDGGFLVSRIAAAVRQAEAPLASFASVIAVTFDRVAGTIITGFRRVDSNTKFPTFDGFFSMAWEKAGKVGQRLGRWALDMGPAESRATGLENAINRLAAAVDRVSTGLGHTPQILTEMTTEIDRAAAKAGILSRAWSAIKAGAPKPPDAVPPAGERPGRGRAIPIDPGDKTKKSAQDLGAGAYASLQFVLGAVRKSAGLAATDFENLARTADRAFGDVARTALASAVQLPVGYVAALAEIGKGFIRFGQTVFRTQFFFSSLGDVAGKTFSALYSGTGLASRAIAATAGNVAKVALTVGSLGAINPFKSMANDAGRMAPAFAKSEGVVTRLRVSVVGLGREIATALGVFGLVYKTVDGIKNFFLAGIKGASDLNESVSAAKVTFGEFFDLVGGQADEMTKAYGISRKAQLDIAAGFGEMAMGAKMSQQEAAKFANTYTALAADLSSRKNIPFADAAAKIQSALAGQAEPLRIYGVLIDEDAVKARALADGIATASGAIKAHGQAAHAAARQSGLADKKAASAKGNHKLKAAHRPKRQGGGGRGASKLGANLDTQAKFATRAKLIFEGLNAAQGDLSRTAGEAANQFRKAGGGLENFGITIGEILLPAVKVGTVAFNDLLGSVIEVFEANRPMIEGWGEALAGVMERVGSVVRNAGNYWTIFRLKATQAAFNVLEVFETLPANFAMFADYLSHNWLDVIEDAMEGFLAIFKNAGAYIADFWGALWEMLSTGESFKPPEFKGFFDGVKRDAAALPDFIKPKFTDMSKEIGEQYDEIARKDKARQVALKMAPGPEGRKPMTPAPDAAAADKKGPQFAQLAEVGSKESYSSIIRNMATGRSDQAEMKKISRDQLQAQKDMLKVLQKNGDATRVDVFSIA